MATRRKYKTPQYRDGGRVAMADVVIAPDVEPAPPFSADGGFRPPQTTQAAPVSDDPLTAALEATRRAEEMQRPPATIEEYVDRIPGLTDHKRAFLKANPSFLHPSNAPVVARHYQAAINAGIPDDTPQIDQFILDGIAREADRRELTAADARPTPDNRAAHEAVADLDREAQALAAAEIPSRPLRPNPSAEPAPRRAAQVSAPVSREGYVSSGQRESTNQIHLSAAEREIAAISFPHLPQREAELTYGRNKQKMLLMKSQGYWDEGR